MQIKKHYIAALFSLFVLLSVALAQNDADVKTIAKILQAEDTLRYGAWLEKIVLDPQAAVVEREMAVKAIGHIGDTKGSQVLLTALNRDFSDKELICRSLGWLWANSPGHAIHLDAPPEVKEKLLAVAGSSAALEVRAAAFEALALAFPKTGQEAAANAIMELADQPANEDLATLYQALIRVAAGGKSTPPPIQAARQTEDPRLTVFRAALQHENQGIVYHAAYFAGRTQSQDLPLTPLLTSALGKATPLARAQLVRAITKREEKPPAGLPPRLTTMLTEGTTQEKIAAAAAVAKFLPGEKNFSLLQKTLEAAGTGKATSLHLAILETLPGVKAPGLSEYLWDVSRRKVPYWRFALVAAAKVGPKEKVLSLSAQDFAVDEEQALLYIEVLSAAAANEKLNWLVSGDGVPAIFRRNLTVRRAAAIALVFAANGEPNAAAIESHESWLSDSDPLIRALACTSIGATGDQVWMKKLMKAWRKAKKDRSPDAALAVLEAMEQIAATEDSLPSTEGMLVETARLGLEDERLAVRRKAVSILYKMTRERHKNKLFGVKTGRSEEDYRSIAERALSGRKTLRLNMLTSKGKIILVLRHDAAPLTADNFARLATAGFYDNLVFHRVVPAFVVQGGDPQRLGWGGPGYAIRDEEGMPFAAGTLGMASAGHDTAGSQFFLTVLPTPHLDAHYTAFGHVADHAEALRILEDIVPGDRIIRVRTEL